MSFFNDRDRQKRWAVIAIVAMLGVVLLSTLAVIAS
jgi:CHASE1-domain containing sensor protein